MVDDNGRPSWMNVTNMLVTISLALTSIVTMVLFDINNKIFVHLTNSEIHIPRSTVVSRDEFVIYQMMRDKQMTDIKQDINDIKCILSDSVTRRK